MSISLKAMEKKIKTNIRPCSIEEFTKFLVICIGSMLGVLLLVYQLYARHGLHFGEKYHGETLSERYTYTKHIGKVSDFGDYPTHWEIGSYRSNQHGFPVRIQSTTPSILDMQMRNGILHCPREALFST